MGFAGRSAVALALMAGALAVCPQILRADQLTSLTGQVLNAYGQVMYDVRVSVTSSSSETVRTSTDTNGRFVFLGLARRNVLVTAAFGLYKCAQDLELTEGETTHLVFHYTEHHISGERTIYWCDVDTFNAQPFDRYVLQ
jgi:Carboxypeptidase regulatory-like domain